MRQKWLFWRLRNSRLPLPFRVRRWLTDWAMVEREERR